MKMNSYKCDTQQEVKPFKSADQNIIIEFNQ